MSQRQAKVESLIQQVVAVELAASLADYRAHVTVTAVDVSPDLKQATVWLSVLESGKVVREQVMSEVDDLRPQIQSQLAAAMTTKFVPHLEFKLDPGPVHAQHIDEVLKEL